MTQRTARQSVCDTVAREATPVAEAARRWRSLALCRGFYFLDFHGRKCDRQPLGDVSGAGFFRAPDLASFCTFRQMPREPTNCGRR